ncbi:unnamed protein product [Cyprideis torosa]|uniref:Uncharacterized protein n=1 Tax=Cyprideis torosa TaxID=163714 RepID=A0A7R8WFE2_9CRUS|nr:unnamed protein product [Cyprideis torosa]CAG0894029.1 unnamed protein product [Cyprideis torosa]
MSESEAEVRISSAEHVRDKNAKPLKNGNAESSISFQATGITLGINALTVEDAGIDQEVFYEARYLEPPASPARVENLRSGERIEKRRALSESSGIPRVPSGDIIDAKGNKRSSLLLSYGSDPTMPVEKDSPRYNMKHKFRGHCVVINQKDFSPFLELSSRSGTDVDRDNLAEVFHGLGYRVNVYNNLSYKEVLDVLDDLKNADHRECDSVVLCYLSHGDTNVLYAHDQGFSPSKMWGEFTADKCPALAGKPKCFFVQACQGDQLDKGVTLKKLTAMSFTQTDAGTDSYKIPVHADFLVAFSTVPGYYSWRNTMNGSWFVQALCAAIRKYVRERDLMSILTIASRYCAVDFESNCPNLPHMHMRKQVPFVTSTLTREIWFYDPPGVTVDAPRAEGGTEDVVMREEKAGKDKKKKKFKDGQCCVCGRSPPPSPPLPPSITPSASE